MRNYNNIRGILRAKQGSQIPKFQSPASPLKINFNSNQKPITDMFQYQKIYNTPYQDLLEEWANYQSGNNPNPYMNNNGQATTKPSASDTKENNQQTNNSGLKSNQIGSMIGQGADIISGMLGPKDGYQGTHGNLQQTGDQLFDQASNTVMMFNPLVGGIMKAGGLVSDVLTNYAGMGTDSMTKTDAILGSKLLSLTPMGMVNGFFGKKTQNFSADKHTIAQVGSSYGGSVADINDAAFKANKKYGAFSSRSRRSANRQIDQARIQQNIMTDIADTAADQRAMVNDLNYINNQFTLNGGYDQRYMRAAKSGMKIQDKIDFIKQRKVIHNSINLETKQVEWEPVIEEFKEGGSLPELWEPVIEDLWEPIIEIPEFQEGGKIRTLEELIKYAKEQNPRFIQRFSEEPRGIKFIDDEGNEAEGSHYLESRGEYVIPRIQEINGELKFLNGQDAIDRAIESGNYLKMLPEEAIIFAENYKQGWPEFFEKFKEGGKTKEELETLEIEETNQKNLIPEGALHKNKHHMEHTEGLTQKGIPVIDNDGEQQAEIELDEIIFTLEVTKKLEELYKEGTDEAAIEAGKLLVKEILFNTDDRTGLIAKCEEGGKL